MKLCWIGSIDDIQLFNQILYKMTSNGWPTRFSPQNKASKANSSSSDVKFSILVCIFSGFPGSVVTFCVFFRIVLSTRSDFIFTQEPREWWIKHWFFFFKWCKLKNQKFLSTPSSLLLHVTFMFSSLLKLTSAMKVSHPFLFFLNFTSNSPTRLIVLQAHYRHLC